MMVPITILNLSVARALNIGCVSYLVNKSRNHKKITRKFQFVMWLAGLRGSMAYALALKSTFDFEKGPVMLITTLIYAFISILLVGSFMNPILERLNVRQPPSKSARRISMDKQSALTIEGQGEYDQGRTRSEGGGSYQTNNCCLRFKKAFGRFNHRYFAPLFIRNMRDF